MEDSIHYDIFHIILNLIVNLGKQRCSPFFVYMLKEEMKHST